MKPLARSVAFMLALAAPLAAQQTTPERTGGKQTSSYADVIGFLDSLQHRGSTFRFSSLGTSTEGRSIPLVIAAVPGVQGPADAQASGRVVVWLQANIHAGEVEGKEAVQMLLRDLAFGPLRPLLDSLVILVVPIYNPDGNEAWAAGSVNRPGQNGPEVVGRRADGLNLDLNRDYVKMEAPETRGAAALIDAWQPDLFIDLHTTNGSYHGYALTYSPGLNPNDTPANAYIRDRFLPVIRERMKSRHNLEIFPYGNFRNQMPDSLVLGWETYDARPRFGTNWTGLRGRMAILSEAYSNDPFPARITATYAFVQEVLTMVAAERSGIRRLVAQSARLRPDSVIVRSVLAPPVVQPVIAELTTPAGDGDGPYARRNRTGQFRTIRMPVYDRFTAARREARPVAYLIPASLPDVANLLLRQGVQVEQLGAPWKGDAERFHVDSISAQPYAFEGHRTVTVDGAWLPAAPYDAAAGSYLVRTDQPLGTLASYLLEPASEDGVDTWNFVDRLLSLRLPHPVARVREPIRATTTELH
jgi:hypothetical protein